jgi:hypothetical protein
MRFTLSNFKDAGGALCAEKISPIAKLASSRTFVETGTYLGETVNAMRHIFERVYSIELSEELHREAVRRFSGCSNVFLVQGNSAEKLQEVPLASGDTTPIFWLDAHWSGGNTARSIENTPIVSELRAINARCIERQIVLIDDLRYFINIPSGFEVHEANYGYPLLTQLLEVVIDLFPAHVSFVNGDLLFVFPDVVFRQLEISKVLMATHQLRVGGLNKEHQIAQESLVACAEGEERTTIERLPEVFSHSLNYGIGGEYLYWRGLVREADGSLDQARLDFNLARKCGVDVPTRRWE